MDGMRIYLEDVGETGIGLTAIRGTEAYAKVETAILENIDGGMPVAYLMLKHQDSRFDFFEWHWFLVIGYEIRDTEVYIKTATYGSEHWLPLAGLWDTGVEEKGGIVLFEEI